jgi:cyclomaltodextrinase / maltogenic alpha-amylase / neopullulanase
MPKQFTSLKHPEWCRNATIYEVSIRHYTEEGTFKAFQNHLPRLKNLGIDIIWIMPIHPIGELFRKGTLGSPYSVKDYYGVNPEFGTLADFKDLINAIHELGMYVIIDWVANHSSWDNELTLQHPEWYTKSLEGDFQPTPWYDWEDIIDFDYDQPGIRKYMTNALKYWMRETGIDGFRCDVAGFVPNDFWEGVRPQLDKIRPVFMLAEWESRDMHRKAFDMTYSWSLYECMHSVTVERKRFAALIEYIAHDVNTVPANDIRMLFTDNHDKNAWTGTPFNMFGDGLEACIVLTCVAKGMPLVYNGQEAGNEKQLPFFEKDVIEWKHHSFFDLYKKLFRLKHSNQALWNGEWGGEMLRISNDKPSQVISFTREKNGDKVIAIFNFSDADVQVKLQTKYHVGQYINLFTEEMIQFSGGDALSLPKWGYSILVKTPSMLQIIPL